MATIKSNWALVKVDLRWPRRIRTYYILTMNSFILINFISMRLILKENNRLEKNLWKQQWLLAEQWEDAGLCGLQCRWRYVHKQGKTLVEEFIKETTLKSSSFLSAVLPEDPSCGSSSATQEENTRTKDPTGWRKNSEKGGSTLGTTESWEDERKQQGKRVLKGYETQGGWSQGERRP